MRVVVTVGERPFALLTVERPRDEVLVEPEVLANMGLPDYAGMSTLTMVVPTFFGPVGTVGVPVPTSVTGQEFFKVRSGVLSQVLEGIVTEGVVPSADGATGTYYRIGPVT